MREIKFRAWDKLNNCMLCAENSTDPYAIGFRNEVYWIDITSNIYQEYDTDEKDTLEIMQYTGLKDKNGKDIHEGDILRYHDELYVVKIDNYKFYAENYYESWQDEPSDMFSEGAHEYSIIVGNIFENSNLLESKNV